MVNVLKAIAIGLFDFFSSKNTPNSGFWVTAFALLGIVAQILHHTGNPLAMAIGAALAAVYTASQNFKEGAVAKADAKVIAAQAQADAIIKAAPSVRLPPPEMAVPQPIEYPYGAPSNPQPGPPAASNFAYTNVIADDAGHK